MASMNLVVLIGHLGQDPKVNFTQSGKAVGNLSVATSSRFGGVDKTEWHRVTVWDKAAEYCRDYLRKGACVSIQGRIETRKWQDKDGKDQYTTEIIAHVVQGLDKRQDSQSHGQSEQPAAERPPFAGGDADGIDPVPF